MRRAVVRPVRYEIDEVNEIARIGLHDEARLRWDGI